jgi:exopolysaccharide biosynthesis predicted pyruvyltransferase EpsI
VALGLAPAGGHLSRFGCGHAATAGSIIPAPVATGSCCRRPTIEQKRSEPNEPWREASCKPDVDVCTRSGRLMVRVEKIALGDWLKSAAAGQVIHWCPNPGNAGDSLIAVATENLFRQKRINFRIIGDPESFDSKGKFVCYGGGGNLISRYKRGKQFVQKHHESAARLVILPHTVDNNEDLLGKFSSRVTIICRELVSYAHCRAAARDADVLAADDIALSLHPPYVSRRQLFLSALAAPRAYRMYRRGFRDCVKKGQGETVLVAWRGDSEQHPSRKEPSQTDLSNIFSPKAKRHSLDRFRLSAYFFLQSISRFSLVRTDRLHVAIGAALLGKKVELYSNSYFKNRAVYEFSLKSFSNVRFVDFDQTAAEGARMGVTGDREGAG